jgi:signal transduction histidine kinase
MLERWQEMLDDAVDRMHELLSGLGTGELDEEEDGCALDFTVDPTSDEDLVALVLFAGMDLEDRAAVAARANEWLALVACMEDDHAS